MRTAALAAGQPVAVSHGSAVRVYALELPKAVHRRWRRDSTFIELSAPLVLQTYERNVAVPTVGGIWRGYLTTNSSITAEFTVFKWTQNKLHAKMSDFDIYGTGNFGKVAGVQFGYRSLNAEYDGDSDAGDLKLKGPYFGFLIRF